MVEEFPHTAVFQSFTEVPDGYGGYTKTWTDALTTDAFFDPISGKERYTAMQLEHPVNIRLYYPFQQGVTGDMRVFWLDRDENRKRPIKIQSNPIDQGGQGEIYMVECMDE